MWKAQYFIFQEQVGGRPSLGSPGSVLGLFQHLVSLQLTPGAADVTTHAPRTRLLCTASGGDAEEPSGSGENRCETVTPAQFEIPTVIPTQFEIPTVTPTQFKIPTVTPTQFEVPTPGATLSQILQSEGHQFKVPEIRITDGRNTSLSQWITSQQGLFKIGLKWELELNRAVCRIQLLRRVEKM